MGRYRGRMKGYSGDGGEIGRVGEHGADNKDGVGRCERKVLTEEGREVVTLLPRKKFNDNSVKAKRL